MAGLDGWGFGIGIAGWRPPTPPFKYENYHLAPLHSSSERDTQAREMCYKAGKTSAICGTTDASRAFREPTMAAQHPPGTAAVHSCRNAALVGFTC